MQIACFGQPVGFSQRQSARRLLQVDPAPYTGFGFLLKAVVDFQVGAVVAGCQGQQVAVAQNVQVRAGSLQSGLVAGRQQLIVGSLL